MSNSLGVIPCSLVRLLTFPLLHSMTCIYYPAFLTAMFLQKYTTNKKARHEVYSEVQKQSCEMKSESQFLSKHAHYLTGACYLIYVHNKCLLF